MNPNETPKPRKSLPERNFEEFMTTLCSKMVIHEDYLAALRCAYFVSAKSVMANLEFLETKVPPKHRRRLKIHYATEIQVAAAPYILKPATN
jgi:hypothetical protein